MGTIARRVEKEHLESHKGVGIRAVSLSNEIVGTVKPLLLVLLGAVCLVLLIACANIANLLLARSAGRQKEIAIRIALGATRWHLIRQLMTESILLALLGAGLGLLWAQWGVELLVRAIPMARLDSMPYLEGLAIDRVVLGFTAGIALITGCLFGLGPAFQGSKLNPNDSLKAGGKASIGLGRRGLRDLIVISEVALALMLLVGAGLMTKSLLRLLNVDPGFNPDNLLTLQLSLPEARYSSRDLMQTFHQQLLERTEVLPGVRGAATANVLPLSGGGGTGGILVQGAATLPPGSETGANLRTVSASYFRTMGIPLIRGRLFTEQDTRDRHAF